MPDVKRYTPDQIFQVKLALIEGNTLIEVQRLMGVGRETVHQVARGEMRAAWGNIPDPPGWQEFLQNRHPRIHHGSRSMITHRGNQGRKRDQPEAIMAEVMASHYPETAKMLRQLGNAA